LRIEDWLDQLGDWIGKRVSKDSYGVSRGFVFARLLFGNMLPAIFVPLVYQTTRSLYELL
jgi:hypothetical protein